jgi:electron transfer flavoprotein alpha subunit
MTILVLAEHDEASLSEQTAKTVQAALAFQKDIHLLVVSETVEAVAEKGARLDGVTKVLTAQDASFKHHLAEPVAALMKGLAENYSVIMAPSSTFGKNILPRLAALLDVMQVSDVMEIVDPVTFKRPIYAGNAIQTVRSRDSKIVMTVRTASFSATGTQETASPVEPVSLPDLGHGTGLSRFVKEEMSESERPDLTAAKVVVSGGRALGSKEKFEALMIPLADKLNAALGASRAAVDAGYAPNDWQVGQTGKIVAPDLYFAIGISGAIQHLAGIKDAGTIVAINKDEDAPIFQVADYGLVADLFDVIPELTDKIG